MGGVGVRDGDGEQITSTEGSEAPARCPWTPAEGPLGLSSTSGRVGSWPRADEWRALPAREEVRLEE